MRLVVSIAMAAVLAAASTFPAMAAKHAKSTKPKMSGACAQPSGRCIFRLRSIELVHDEHLHKRPVDTGTVLALLPAERPMPRPTLLRNRTSDAHPQCPFGA
jgi:hypothetical protein